MPTRDELLAQHNFIQSLPGAYTQGIYADQPDGSRKKVIGLYYTEGHQTIYLSFSTDDRTTHFPGNLMQNLSYKRYHNMTTDKWLDWVEAFVQAWVDELNVPTDFSILTTRHSARHLIPRGFVPKTTMMLTKPFTPNPSK